MTYDRIEEAARLARMPQVQWQCQRARRNFEKSGYGPSTNATATAKLQRMLRLRAEEHRAAVLKKRQKAFLGRKLAQRLRARAAAEKAAGKARAEETAARQAAVDALPKAFNAINTGPKGGHGKTGLHMRLLALERLRLCAPPLPAHLEPRWPEFCAWYARDVAQRPLDRRTSCGSTGRCCPWP